MKFTLIGGRGFIGRNIAQRLKAAGVTCFVPERDDPAIFDHNLGKVIYCAGVTADYRIRPFDTVRAHVSLLAEMLEKAEFDSFLYLSSTRVYFANSTGQESIDLIVNPNMPDYIFNLSKLMGEALCLSQGHPEIRIARIANVYGDDFASDNFLFSIIKDAVNTGKIVLQTALESEKDYIGVDDVAELLIKISQSGKARLYNVASGTNISHRDIVERIRSLTDCEISVKDGAPIIRFPRIDTSNICSEFGYKPGHLLDNLPELVMEYKTKEVIV